MQNLSSSSSSTFSQPSVVLEGSVESTLTPTTVSASSPDTSKASSSSSGIRAFTSKELSSVVMGQKSTSGSPLRKATRTLSQEYNSISPPRGSHRRFPSAERDIIRGATNPPKDRNSGHFSPINAQPNNEQPKSNNEQPNN